MLSNVIPLMQVSVFCTWSEWVLSDFLSLPDMRKIQVDGKEYMGKDWRTITFRQDHSIQLKKCAYCVFICMRTNLIGERQHAVSNEYHEENSKAQKRSKGSVPSKRELMMSCHHELCNLQLCADIWWCTKDWTSTLVYACQGLCFLWEDVHCRGYVRGMRERSMVLL